MSSKSRLQLIAQLRKAQDFLLRKLETHSAYGDLYETLKTISDRLEAESKPLIKFVSPNAALATSLQTQHQEHEQLQSFYRFASVSPIGQIREILAECDFLCLVYDRQRQLREHHYKLIELARNKNIPLAIAVQPRSAESDPAVDKAWQQDLDALKGDLILLGKSHFIDYDCPEALAQYQQSLVALADEIERQRHNRIVREVRAAVKTFFESETGRLWQEIRESNSVYLGGQPLHVYQQQFRQDNQAFNQFHQKLIREIKQTLNHLKTDWLNPFAIDGLIFKFQQAIDLAEIKIIPNAEDSYLYLVLPQFPQQPLLHDYILELCQQRANAVLAEQWTKIDSVYEAGGLKLLRERRDRELGKMELLLDAEFLSTLSDPLEQPSLDVTQVIDPYCLEVNSRLAFDYSLTQSSWFRLFISTLIGMAIYIATWLYSGTGRYIGFMIIIFQLINLITGQSMKKNRLKQQTKELKRLADQKCQSVVRTTVGYLSQTIIIAIDRESQCLQQEHAAAIAIAQGKLDELKQANEAQKATIEQLKRDRDRINDWLN